MAVAFPSCSTNWSFLKCDVAGTAAILFDEQAIQILKHRHATLPPELAMTIAPREARCTSLTTTSVFVDTSVLAAYDGAAGGDT